jgi:hypothetical protein
LNGGFFDGLKQRLALFVLRSRFGGDAALREHADPRVAAVVAGAPHAVSFDLASLERPRVPLGLVSLEQDRWLVPRFHSERVLQACASCERVAALPEAGHGALLSPLPPGLSGLAGELLNDPAGFDRAALAAVDRAISAFFERHLQPMRQPAAGANVEPRSAEGALGMR